MDLCNETKHKRAPEQAVLLVGGGSAPIVGKHASLVRSLQEIRDSDGSAQRAGSGACFLRRSSDTKGWASKQGKSWS